MKYICQLGAFIITTSAGLFVFLHEKNLDIGYFQNVLAIINGIAFAMVSPMFLVLYVMMLMKERKQQRVCLTVAQYVCLGSFLVCCTFSYMSFEWLSVQTSCQFDTIKNTFWKALDCLLWILFAGIAISYSTTFFGFAIIPVISVNPKKPLGDYIREIAKQKKFDTDSIDELIEEAYKKQHDDT